MPRIQFEALYEGWKLYEAGQRDRMAGVDIDWLIGEVSRLEQVLADKDQQIETVREEKIQDFTQKVNDACDAQKATSELKRHNVEREGDVVSIDFAPSLTLKSASNEVNAKAYYLIKQKLENKKYINDELAERMKKDITDCFRGQGTYGNTV